MRLITDRLWLIYRRIYEKDKRCEREIMKVETLSEKYINEIGHAFGYYE